MGGSWNDRAAIRQYFISERVSGSSDGVDGNADVGTEERLGLMELGMKVGPFV
jgi:hypothetical protein